MPSLSIEYVAHSPWKWVMERVQEDINNSEKPKNGNTTTITNMKEVASRDDLPSAELLKKLSEGIPSYKKKKLRNFTFLLDVVQTTDKAIHCCYHGISGALDGLEDKDELVRTFQRCRIEHLEYTPPSLLLRWDTTLQECQLIVKDQLPMLQQNTNENGNSSTTPFAVLKEPLSTKGEGIHFVRNVQEIYDILEQHKNNDDALTEMMDIKGRIPSWILQAEIYPARLIRDDRKFHMRSLIVAVETLTEQVHEVNLYLFQSHEVRLAAMSSAEDENTGERCREAHITNAKTSSSAEENGNKNRLFVMSEMEELQEYQPSLELFCASTFLQLLPDITRRVAYTSKECGSSEQIQKHVLGGVDCMMTQSGKWYLLEVNKNPSCPPLAECQPSLQQHLIEFGRDLQHLLTTGTEKGTKFVKLEDLIPKR
mmetsp:Transcript_7526/g.11483  ORF Transcript_7526/g.11483 Transcript_7526/m.11483 type:complete len:425 (+) Transcript_7526:114-1388(+)